MCFQVFENAEFVDIDSICRVVCDRRDLVANYSGVVERNNYTNVPDNFEAFKVAGIQFVERSTCRASAVLEIRQQEVSFCRERRARLTIVDNQRPQVLRCRATDASQRNLCAKVQASRHNFVSDTVLWAGALLNRHEKIDKSS